MRAVSLTAISCVFYNLKERSEGPLPKHGEGIWWKKMSLGNSSRSKSTVSLVRSHMSARCSSGFMLDMNRHNFL